VVPELLKGGKKRGKSDKSIPEIRLAAAVKITGAAAEKSICALNIACNNKAGKRIKYTNFSTPAQKCSPRCIQRLREAPKRIKAKSGKRRSAVLKGLPSGYMGAFNRVCAEFKDA
jgi:hypothetical protein